MMMDSDSVYKPNGDYLMSPYGWHTPQDLQFVNAPAYPYGDYGPVLVKSEYDDCGGGGSGIGGDGSSSSPGLEQDSAEPKKGKIYTGYIQGGAKRGKLF